MIFSWCRSRGHRDADAADIVQEVLGKLISKLRVLDYQPERSFRAWLRTVTVNQSTDFRRRASNRRGLTLKDIEEPVVKTDAIDVFDQTEYCRFLVARGQELIRDEFSKTTWSAFWKYAAEGRGAREVASELGVSVNAVRVAKCRVMARLRQELDGLID